MKNKMIVLSAILLISVMVAGGTFAWFTSSLEPKVNNFKIGLVKVKVIEKDLKDIRVKNMGTSESYIRVRLIPQWSDPSLSVSNVNINIRKNNWIEKDGYYYYKKILEVGEETSNLIKSISVPTVEGETFTLKVVAEGVQTTHEAWKDVWSIDNLPF